MAVENAQSIEILARHNAALDQENIDMKNKIVSAIRGPSHPLDLTVTLHLRPNSHPSLIKRQKASKFSIRLHLIAMRKWPS